MTSDEVTKEGKVAETKIFLLLPSWFFKRQFIVSFGLFVVFPLPVVLGHNSSTVNWLLLPFVLLAFALLYPYSRYAVQWIIDYWNGGEQVVYDGSFKSSIDRKFAKLIVSLVFILVLGPLCVIALLVKHWRARRSRISREPASG
ncbi:hypothetical protein ACW5XE_12640 [Aeromonas caviae]|uniref:hypothetical protein n=1 Tax=Aeromonas caviae TaxID=648 RepID=UPI002B4830A8|nr:hypothetical protein [Aeromonas caviae]